MSRPLHFLAGLPETFRVAAAASHGDVAKGATGTAYRQGRDHVRVAWDSGPTLSYYGGDLYTYLLEA